MKIVRQDREKLKDIVRGYIANEIFFSAQVRDPSLVPMVFMPIAMGMLSYPVEKPEGTKKPAAPARPVRPTKGVVDLGQEGQKLADEITQTEELITKVEFRARWGEASPDELSGLRQLRDSLAAELDRLSQAANLSVEEDHKAALANYLTDLKEYRSARHAWRATVRTWEEGEEGLAKRVAVWEEGRKEWHDTLARDLGVIYAYTKGANPRSINGYPMFMECGLMHKLDWDLVRKAIDKELERQKDIDLGDDATP